MKDVLKEELAKFLIWMLILEKQDNLCDQCRRRKGGICLKM